ncbi:UDP-glucose/GDP-mannose dehydrogenase family, UDP binding domain [compost metagenome]
MIDVIQELQEFACDVDVYDPWADAEEVQREYNLTLLEREEPLQTQAYDAVVLAVAHDVFREYEIKPSESQVVYDIKSVLEKSDGRL